jgi:hypothetical protein
MMLKLIFNTTKKTVNFIDHNNYEIIYENISTVKPNFGFYEVIQEDKNINKKYPIFRAPINQTLMYIER